MTDYKLVPLELTDEMAEASGCDGYFRKSAYDQAQDMWSAMLAAAPAVQGEPVGWESIDGLPHEPDDDQVFWFARSDGYVEGPRQIQPGGYDYEEFEFFCPAEPPPLGRYAMLIADALSGAAPQPAEQQPIRNDKVRAEFEKWASTHFFLQEEDTIVDDSYEYISVDMQLAWEACDTALFCDLKTDEEKSTFFLSGRGYETGVIAQAIQNDVAMAYHRCSEYREEMEALQAECEELRAEYEEELFQVRQDRDAHFGELMRAIEQVDALKAECEELRTALAESRANDRQAMAYLTAVREVVGGDDFPDMVRRCEDLRKVADQYRRLIELGEDFQWENIIRVDISDFPSRAAAIDAAIDAAMEKENKE